MRKEIKCTNVEKWLHTYTLEEIENALNIAVESSRNLGDTLYAAGNESAAEVSIASSLSFERVFRASLGIEEVEEENCKEDK